MWSLRKLACKTFQLREVPTSLLWDVCQERRKNFQDSQQKFFLSFTWAGETEKGSQINRKSFSIIVSSWTIHSTQSFTPSNVRKCHHSVNACDMIYESFGGDCIALLWAYHVHHHLPHIIIIILLLLLPSSKFASKGVGLTD